MKAQYCIYFDDRSLLITSSKTRQQPGAIVKGDSVEEIKSAIELLDKHEAKLVVIESNDPGTAFNTLKCYFYYIQAGGGLVKNEKNEYLFIFRRGKWDLPKGKLDEGETIAECAVREVREETGLIDVELGSHLVNTWHVYHEKDRFILKESVWFNMSCSSKQALTPQTEEDIFEIKWLAKDAWALIYNNTFPSIKQVLELNASGL